MYLILKIWLSLSDLSRLQQRKFTAKNNLTLIMEGDKWL